MKRAQSLLILVALSLGGCTVPTGPVEVTTFNRVAEGQIYGSGSFSVIAASDLEPGQGPIMSPYIAAVAREMSRVGYADKNTNSDVVAEVRVTSLRSSGGGGSPVSVGVGGSTGSYGSGVGLGVGLNLGGRQAQIETTLSVRILRSRDNLVIWEGRASQVAGRKSPAAQPGIAASKLAEALFSGFPGRSGETITVP